MSSSDTKSHLPLKPTIYLRDDHCISRSDIDPDALKIMYRLIHYGHKAYMVGGGVRDLLLGKKPKDFDISTDATPRRIKEIFRNSRIIGRRFKLVHVYFRGNKIIELSTFRDFTDQVEEEIETESENESNLTMPARDNKYGTEETDALRRDLTINGLFYDIASFSIIDYVGGMKDLRDGIIRIIGDPDIRFPEDPVRMIRVVRHAVRTGFSIEESAWRSINRNKHLICDIAPMRIFEEIKKDLVSGHCLEILRLLEQSKLLALVMPLLAFNSGEVLAPHTPLSGLLHEVDERIRQNKTVSPTVTLSLLAYGTWPVVSGVYTDNESATADFLTHFERCFGDLAVPRKERERIELIVGDWLDLREENPQHIKGARFAKKAHLDDLIQFAEIAGGTDDGVSIALTKIKKRNLKEDSQNRRDERIQRQKPSHGRRSPRIL